MALIPKQGFDIEGPSTAPNVEIDGASGYMAPGSYKYKITYTNRYGETLAGPPSNTVITLTGSALLTNIPLGHGNVTTRNIYRTSVGEVLPYRLIGEVGDNITTTYTDISDDLDLGAPEPVNSFAPSVAVERGWTILSHPAIHPIDTAIIAAGNSYSTATRCSQTGEYFLVSVPSNLNGVILPPLTINLVGMVIVIKNTSNINQLNVYPEDISGQINAAGAGVPRVLQPGTSENFLAVTTVNWNVITTTAGGGGGVATFDGGSTGLTPSVPSGGIVSLGGTLNVTNGGTGLTTAPSGSIVYGNGASALGTSLGTAGQLLVSGGTSAPGWTGAITYNGTTITGVSNPINGPDVANKSYVDSIAAGFNVHAAVQLATTGALSAMYNNGVSGVGATLTSNLPYAPLQIDSTPVAPLQRILVKNQADQKQNGVYIVTTVGTVLLPWVLTRASDFDNSPNGEVVSGDFLFVEVGYTNGTTGWIQTQVGSGIGGGIVMGTDPLLFSQFSSGATYAAGTGLNLLGNTFNNTGVLTASGGVTGLTFNTPAGDVELQGILSAAHGGTGTTTGIDVALDPSATPTYPQNLLSGVWYGTGTRAAGNSNSVRVGNNASATGINSIALGNSARANADSSVAVGTNAGPSNALATNVTAIGYNAGAGIMTGINNIAVGSSALGTGTVTGTANVVVGNNAGSTITTGSNNVLIGHAVDVNSGVRTDAVALGRGIIAIEDNGFFVRHRGPAGYTVNVAGFIPGTNELVEVSSSIRTKENIRELEDTSEQFNKLNPVRYTPKLVGGLRSDEIRENIGLIAEEVIELYPEVVTFDTEGRPAGLVYDRLVPVLIERVQAQSREIDELKCMLAKILNIVTPSP